MIAQKCELAHVTFGLTAVGPSPGVAWERRRRRGTAANMATLQPGGSSAALVPRRWNVEVDGICWLPRMADKARMQSDGRLGAYLMGHSPVDKALLRRLGMTTREFVTMANASPGDAALLAALRARGFDEGRVRAWCGTFTKRYSGYISLWDLDEGYRRPKPFERPLIAVARVIEGPVMGAFRRLVSAP